MENTIKNYLNYDTFVSRGELAIMTGLTDRDIRNRINKLKKSEVVISNSKTSGYRLAKNIDDLNTLDSALKELKLINISINEIEARIRDLSEGEDTYITYKKSLEEKIKKLIKDLENESSCEQS